MGKRKQPKPAPTERARKIRDIRIQIVELELQIQELNDEFLREVYLLLGLNSDDLSTQIRRQVGHGYRVVKQALYELKNEKKILRTSVENKLGRYSEAFFLVPTTKKSTR